MHTNRTRFKTKGYCQFKSASKVEPYISNRHGLAAATMATVLGLGLRLTLAKN